MAFRRQRRRNFLQSISMLGVVMTSLIVPIMRSQSLVFVSETLGVQFKSDLTQTTGPAQSSYHAHNPRCLVHRARCFRQGYHPHSLLDLSQWTSRKNSEQSYL